MHVHGYMYMVQVCHVTSFTFGGSVNEGPRFGDRVPARHHTWWMEITLPCFEVGLKVGGVLASGTKKLTLARVLQ